MLCGNVLSPSDPYILDDSEINPRGSAGMWRTADAPARTIVIDPAKKTLVLCMAGQSQISNLMPTNYAPANSDKVSHLNVYDGAFYPISGPLLGTTYAVSDPSYGTGNIAPRIADKLIDGGKWDQVLISNVAVGGTTVAQWQATLRGRVPVALARLAARGITPAAAGVYFSLLWMQGENDTTANTSQADYTASLAEVLAHISGAGFAGRTFICKESYYAGVVSTAVRAAQMSLVNGSAIFSGGDLDALGSSYRQSDNLHFNDSGAEEVASKVVAAMTASGSPF